MKKILSLLGGLVIMAAFGMAYADDMMPGNKDTGDKMVRDDDLQKYDRDLTQGTVNQMPSEQGAEGTAGGGVSGEKDSTVKKDTHEGSAPVENYSPEPKDEGNGLRGGDDVYRYYRY